jgi:hypothetical protein
MTQRVAGSEVTDKYSPLAALLTPDALVTGFHTWWLRAVSSILRE